MTRKCTQPKHLGICIEEAQEENGQRNEFHSVDLTSLKEGFEYAQIGFVPVPPKRENDIILLNNLIRRGVNELFKLLFSGVENADEDNEAGNNKGSFGSGAHNEMA